MQEIEILKDILEYRISSQKFYNEMALMLQNPEARQLFTQLRDDEMYAVIQLQQRITRIESTPKIITRLFPERMKH